ncbi:hypothetical protein LOD99_8278 [Oopsacas minuta]|uniref:Uncharacterized protein n=1 Tax=Oopsacas minuta TaxID=111878 RepID=A0AAV7JGQ0_9METZ|nr:hypothetical protein LOD99_8278 [Oopsacas minuta]
MRSRSSILNIGSIGEVLRVESCNSDHVDYDYKGLPNSSLTSHPYFSDDINNNKRIEYITQMQFLPV